MQTSIQDNTRPLWSRRISLAVLLAIGLGLFGQFAQTVRAEVIGNTFVDAQRDVSMSWDDNWFLVETSSEDGVEQATITNGLTYCTIFSGPDPGMSPEGLLAAVLGGFRADPAISDFAPMRDADGDAIRFSDARRAFAVFTATYSFEEVGQESLALYVEVRLGPKGFAAFTAQTLAASFESERPQFQAVLHTLAIGPPEPVKGEPAPVFASGPWRVAVATSAVRESFPDYGLKAKAGKEWLVVVLDVTNWSDVENVFAARKVTIGTGPGQKDAKVARGSMPRIAEALGTTPFGEGLTLAIAPDATVRMAIAFLIPAGTDEPMLKLGGNALSLAGIVDSELDPARLATAAGPAEVTLGTLASASDGQTIRIQLDGEQKSRRYRLLGVNPPIFTSCFANAAERTLDDLADGEASVLVEEDPAVESDSDPLVYVWLINQDGSRTLLNQLLIADGSAYSAGLPDDARFGSWLESSATAAEAAGLGLWAGCPTPESTSAVDVAATPAATPAGR